jgi:beta-lactamase regulating signal transducer with metallopeptidase domain
VTAVLLLLTLKVSAVLIVAWALTRAMARCSAASRHLVWTVAIIATFVLPAAHLAGPHWSLALLPASDTSPAQAGYYRSQELEPSFSPPAVSEDPVAPRVRTATSDAGVDWASIVIAAWLCGIGVGLLRFIAGLVSASRITRRANPVDSPGWLTTLGEAASAVGLTAPVRLKSSTDTTIPVAWGIVKPTVILPPDAETWSPDRRHVVLVHELAHVRRQDCLVQSLAQIARSIYWLNPLAHIAVRRLRMEQERACDDIVLNAGTDGPLYADHLIDIARASLSHRPHECAVLGMAHHSQLEGRLMAILNNAGNRRPPSRWVRMLVGGCGTTAVALLGTLQLTSASDRAERREQVPEQSRIEETAPQPPAASLPGDAPADAPRSLSQPAMPPPNLSIELSDVPRIVDHMIDSLPDVAVVPNPDPDARQVPEPNPRPNVQLKGAPAPPAPEVSEETRRRVADALQTALADDNEEVRVQALLALTGLGDERAIPGLLKAARDTSPRVRMAAVRALAQFSTTAAVDALTASLKDTEAEVRQQAARALGQIVRGQRGARSVPPIPPMPPASPVPPSPARPGASIVPPTPPRVSIDLDRIDEIVSQAQQDARRVLEEFGRNRQEMERQQQELERQREELKKQLR